MSKQCAGQTHLSQAEFEIKEILLSIKAHLLNMSVRVCVCVFVCTVLI